MVKEEIVFDNDLRTMIYNHIVNYPGVTFNTLLNIFKISDGGLRYHLDYLIKCEKINVKMENGQRNYYPHFDIIKQNVGNSKKNQLNENQNKLLDIIKNHPGISQKDLVFRTRLSRFQVSNNIKNLKEYGLVKELRIGRSICYREVPDDELRTKIVKKLIIRMMNGEIDEETFLKIMRSLG